MENSNEQNFWFGGNKPFTENEKSFSTRLTSKDLAPDGAANSVSNVFRFDEALLRDHVIYGEPVLVGAAYLSMFIELGLQHNNKKDFRIHRLTYINALVIGQQQSKTVTARIRHENDRNILQARVLVNDVDEVYAEGYVRDASGDIQPNAALNLRELLSTAVKREFPEEKFYRHPDQATYGPSLMSVFSVYRLAGPAQVLGEIRLTEEMVKGLGDYYIHPALFDACHVTTSFVLGEDVVAQHRVPLMIKEVAIHYVEGLNLEYAFCHVELVQSNDQIAEMNFRLADGNGLVIASAKGFVTKTVPSKDAIFSARNTADVSHAREAIPAPVVIQSQTLSSQSLAGAPLEKSIREYLRRKLGQTMNSDASVISLSQNFMELGIESNSMVNIVQGIEREVGLELYPTLMFEYQNLNTLAEFLARDYSEPFSAFLSSATISPVAVDTASYIAITETTEIAAAANTITEKFTGKAIHPLPSNSPNHPIDLKKDIQIYLKQKIARLLNAPADQISAAKNFMDLGIDSNNMIEIVREIETECGIELYPTLLFERQNIEQLSEYFVQESADAFGKFLSFETPLFVVAANSGDAIAMREEITTSQPAAQVSDVSPAELKLDSNDIPNYQATNTHYQADLGHRGVDNKYSYSDGDDIAIVGMSGYLPQSANLQEFWQHLENGDDLISEIPADHWDINAWYSPDKKAANKTYSRWGGFLNNIDKFDANFFGISPRQAEWIDPQLRLLLQSVQHTLEDACQINSIIGSKTGVYVGCCFQEYWDEIVRARVPLVDYQADSSVMSSLAATVAYMFDLQGAAIPLDNACASSLTALHLACQSLRTGENEQAVVAGVNALLSPLHYVYFSRMQALSPTGRCYSFDKKADGYVPGEGTVSILIKPLKKALADGDNIHAIIKASGINHVGRSNNAVSPRPELQSRLLRDTWDRFGINPADFTYMEAHGTGTVLGDPIEVNALKAAFKHYTSATGFCTLGSTKAHVGHLEGAAGLASVIKVILMMKNRKIPKMPNFEELNPYIKLSDSPFDINREILDWQVSAGKKRLAGVSAFGMTGNNSHVVLEEYSAPERAGASTIPSSYFIPLSGKTPERLKAGVKTLLEYLQRTPAQPAIADLSFSLQVGRQSMAERIVLCVTSHQDLIEQLNQYLQESNPGHIRGRAPAEVELTDHFPDLESFSVHLQSLYRAGALTDIAHLWIKGLQPDWASLRRLESPRKISLPGYSFALDRYWIPEEYKQVESISLESPAVGHAAALSWQVPNLKPALHPLVHENCSNFEVIRFCTSFSGAEFFVDEHRINGERILPGVAYLEMAIAAAELATQKKALVLRNISWIRPVVVAEKEKELVTTLTSQGEEVKFKISSAVDGLHCQGVVVKGDQYPAAKLLDIAAIKRALPEEASAHRIYSEFEAQGIEYGAAFRSLEDLRFSSYEVCARFVLQREHATHMSAFVLDPSIMDAALQATIGLKFANAAATTEKKLELPFAINAVSIYSLTQERGYIYVRYSPGSGFHDRVSSHDIDICDEQGNICVSIIGFSTRTILLDDSSQGASAANKHTSIPAARQKQSAGVSRSVNIITPADSGEADLSSVKNYLQHNVADILKLRVDDVPLDEEMGSYGLDSITLTELSNRISLDLDLQLAPTVFFEYATLENFALYLSTDFSENIERYFSRSSFASGSSTAVGSTPVLPDNPASGSEINNFDHIQLERLLQEKVGEILKLSADEITLDESMSSFGLDSITLSELSNFVVETFNIQLTPTIFFEHTTLESFAEYLRTEHLDAVNHVINNSAVAPQFESNNSAQHAQQKPSLTEESAEAGDAPILQQKNWNEDDIAIVGISACFPMANNIDEFWQNIAQGKDCISEIPTDRWDWREIFGDPLTEENRSNVKWGGFIQELDKFDPLFFGISPHEAELMDPQQRLLLEHAWSAIEDAGQSAKDLWGSTTGVFVGTSVTGYHKRVLESDIPIEGHSSTAVVPSAGPNRLSYYLNLHGPSEPIETACSSALVAIHRGILAIQSGECDQVLAGGINTLLSPEVHLSFNKAGMLCEDGRCKTFSSDANGYVRGEGAGIILLKRLSEAKKDRNTIYAVIKSSAENHGGRAQSLTAPNVNAQVDLLVSAYAKAKIDPRTITYIEAHGTGTPLGDPIEINALKKAFTRLYELNGVTGETVPHCGIGSVKSNIGHLELAAGIAGVIKVLVAMKQGVLPASIHCEQTNPYIDLENSPFYIVKDTRAWMRQTDGAGRELPRRAGVSSFGFGGVNAHLILEEYIEDNDESSREQTREAPAQVLYPLSAKSEFSLKNSAQRLRDFLTNNNPSLSDVAFTLQAGRVSMEYRLAIVAMDKMELLQLLDRYIAGETHPRLLTSTTGSKGPALPVDMHTKPVVLAQAWLKSGYFQWSQDYIRELKPKRISLPTYAFARERHWLYQKPFGYSRTENDPAITYSHKLLPLQNASTLFEQKYYAEFNGKEWYFSEHRVNGKKIFPGVAYIELACAAAEQAAQQRVVRVEGINWSAPLVAELENQLALAIYLSPEANASRLEFGIYDANDSTLYSQGRLQLADDYPAMDARNIGAIKDRCTSFYAKEFIYKAFSKMGLEYGRAFRAIEDLYSNGQEVFARLHLPESVENSLQTSLLPPSLLDAALQSVIGFSLHREALAGTGDNATIAQRNVPYIPFSVENLHIYSPLQRELFVYVKEITADVDTDIVQYDIEVLNGLGEICIKLEKFSARRMLQQNSPMPQVALEQSLLTGYFAWKKSEEPAKAKFIAIPENSRVMVADIDAAKRLKKLNPTLDVYPLDLGDTISECALRDGFLQAFEQVQSLLVQSKRGKSHIFVIVPEHIQAFRSAALVGLLKTAQLENPLLVARLLYVTEHQLTAPELLCSMLTYESTLACPLVEVTYNSAGLRYEKMWSDLEISSDTLGDNSVSIKPGGTYWISGGMGGLGIIFAKYILGYERTRVVLSGRSPLDQKQQTVIATLGSDRLEYLALDFNDEQSVREKFAYVKSKYQGLNGIIHSAGVIRDAFILKKTPTQIAEVWAGKVGGLLALDNISQHERLDFIISFSSIAGCFGSLGQADYAGANSVLDGYMAHRDNLVKNGERHGASISIAWPLWADGGMQVDRAISEQMEKMSGLVPLATAAGIVAFEYALQRGAGQFIVLAGNHLKLRQSLPIVEPKDINATDRVSAEFVGQQLDAETLSRKTIEYLKRYLADALKIPAHKIDENAELEKYGIDSVMVLKLGAELEKLFGRLPKTLFYEYKNIRELSNYFITQQRDKLMALITPSAEKVSPAIVHPIKATVKMPLPKMQSIAVSPNLVQRQTSPEDFMSIAIVGVDGRYPQADNLAEYWENLRTGRDCISEIPADRWNHADFYSGDKNQSGSVYSKWGGFIADVDKFDPLFFNISPREAEAMDPQERLFLQTAWKCLEDAGYTRKNISRAESGRRNVGVFVGVMYEEYQLYAAQEQLKGNNIGLGGNPSSIANRVSYICDFNGPSMAIDTMCSSSLTAVHLACQSLRDGKCTAALAGGVNLSVHPNKYIFLSQGKFISTSGRCESFGIGGDGYVPGEGVGCLLLKPLAAAQRDGDHIYGLIKGSALNHGGKTNGYTVPNPLAQSEVIRQAIDDARVDPRMISYIEAHGTGTSLGDPIEISGLSRAFANAGIAAQSCAIGSAKSNIGHCESAAGIAGISKVLLQMKHGLIAPSIHAEILNPNIDFEETPFLVQQHLSDWQRPIINSREYNRIAGVSSFGAGGSNAHIILEEYRQPIAQIDLTPVGAPAARLFLLSARTPESLREYAVNIKDFIEAQQHTLDLDSLIYTLATGREAMEYRIAFSIDSLSLISERLDSFLHGNSTHADIYYGNIHERSAIASIALDTEFVGVIGQWVAKGKLENIAELWVHGLDVEWEKIYLEVSHLRHSKLAKISLPTYPFARERYWVDITGSIGAATNADNLHPLLSSNISDLYTQKYRSDLLAELNFVADHNINGDYLLPGVVYLEMARAAGELASQRPVVALKNIVWSAPVVFRDNKLITATTHLTLLENPALIGFEIFSQDGARLHAEGQLQLGSDDIPADLGAGEENRLDLGRLRGACKNIVNKEVIYEAFARRGMEYGPSLQCLAEINVGDGQLLARAKLIKAGDDIYFLHPGLMDAALQSLIGFALSEQQGKDPDSDERKVFVPFSLQQVNIIATLPSEIYIHARLVTSDPAANIRYYDIDIADVDGNLCVALQGFSVRQLVEINNQSTSTSTSTSTSRSEVFYGKFSWQANDNLVASAPESFPADNAQQIFRLVIGDTQLAGHLEKIAGKSRVSVLPPVTEFSEATLRQQFMQVFTQLRELFMTQPAARKNIVICVSENSDELGFAHISGLIKSAHQEHPQLNAKLVILDETLLNDATLVEGIMRSEVQRFDGYVDVRYTANGQRMVKQWHEIVAPINNTNGPAAICEQGVYWISGGLGGLGVIIARHLLAQSGTRVILSGRSAMTDKQQALLAELGECAEYLPLDIAVQGEVEKAFLVLKKKYGKIHGVIHSAGIIRDAFLVKKTEQEIADVWRAKISGAIHLDKVTQHEPLDFFVVFSSIAGSFGSVGQADYSAANSLLDAFCQGRNQQVGKGMRSGASISLAWPLWKDGGMQLDTATIDQVARVSGMQPLETAEGCAAFDVAMNMAVDNLVILNGDKQKIISRLIEVDKPLHVVIAENIHQHVVASEPQAKVGMDSLREATQVYLKTLLAKTLKLPSHRIDASQPLEKYGIDSVMIMTLTNDLEAQFGELSKTLFFEYKTIIELADYFISAHFSSLQEAVSFSHNVNVNLEKIPGFEQQIPERVKSRINVAKLSDSGKLSNSARFSKRFLTAPSDVANLQQAFDVAIIGISGRYPQSVNIDAFWENLKNGNDCITEIPGERWDFQQYFGVDGSPVYSKWGGFIQDVDKFDPLFFNISPREAEIIDPQERLFLQHAWECMENAGYTRSSIVSPEITERDVGVFVGVMYEEYQLFGAQEQQKGNLVGLTANPSGIANRVSYFCDFHGPSMAVDTMCSSSLTAIHLACQSLRDRECSVALAGGVNISIHPNKYLLLSQGKFISSRGRCESFGRGGDGYVPGEGVGCLLLKPLADAEADGDFIYGVIKGTAINHGGKTNGYTVPNPVAQARVIDKALNAAQLPATAISYIEAHGTGTSLGDPIEIAGLNKVFLAAGVEPGSCAIGSAKSNIGHCESAAGVAGVTKVLLQMQHGLLVPSIHSAELNPNIDFERSAFNVQQELAEWKRKKIDGVEIPRVAGISSFGAGGSNAHIIIQEYQRNNISQYSGVAHNYQKQLTIISARSMEQLVEYAQRYIDFLDAQPDVRLDDIAFSSQTGREEFKHRLALISDSPVTLRSQLQAVLSGQADATEGIFMAKVAEDKNKFSLLTSDEDLRQGVQRWIEKGKLNELAELWVAGLSIDWSLLRNANPTASRIPIPSYPFLNTRYWFSPEPAPLPASVGTTGHLSITYPGIWIKDEAKQISGLRENLIVHAGKTLLLLTDSPSIQMAYTQFIAALNEILSTLGVLAINARSHLIGAATKLPAAGPADIIFLMAANSADIIGNQEQYAARLCKIASDYPGTAVYTFVDTGKVQGAMVLDSLYHQAVLQKESRQAPSYCVGIDYSASAHYLIKVAVNEFLIDAEQLPVQICRYLGDVRWVKQFNTRTPATALSAQNPEQHIHLVEKRWRKSVPVIAAKNTTAGKVLLICNSHNQHFIEEYRHRFMGQDCIAAVITADYQENRSDDTRIFIRVQETESLVETLQSLLQHHSPISSVIDISSLGIDTDQLDKTGVGMFTLYQYLTKQFTAMQVLHFTNNLQSFKSEAAGISGAKSAGLIKMLSAEYANINAKTIDIDNAALVGESFWRILVDETAAVLEETEITYRKGERFVPFLQRDLFSKKMAQPIGYDENGAYVISGGTSGIGLKVAFHLAEKGVKKLVLMGATQLPMEREWEVLVQANSTPEALREKLSAFVRLKKSGVSLKIYSASLTDEASLGSFIATVKQEWGKIRGVVHSAGAMSASRDGEFAFVRKKVSQVASVLSPKVEGIAILHNLVAGDDLDFFVAFSSTSGYLPNFMRGLSDYGTANAFIDYFLNYQARGSSTRYRSIAWVGWSDTGSHTRDTKVQQLAVDGAKQYGLLFNDSKIGLEMFDYALARDSDDAALLPCLLNVDVFDSRAQDLLRCEVQRPALKQIQENSKFSELLKRLSSDTENIGPEMLEDFDLDSLEEWQIEKLSSIFLSQVEKLDVADTAAIVHPIVTESMSSPVEVAYASMDLPPRVPAIENIQKLLIDCMSDILKIENNLIEKSESFQSYGLDSISGTQLTSKLEQALNFEMSSAWLLEYSTVNELSQMILKKLTGKEFV